MAADESDEDDSGALEAPKAIGKKKKGKKEKNGKKKEKKEKKEMKKDERSPARTSRTSSNPMYTPAQGMVSNPILLELAPKSDSADFIIGAEIETPATDAPVDVNPMHSSPAENWGTARLSTQLDDKEPEDDEYVDVEDRALDVFPEEAED